MGVGPRSRDVLEHDLQTVKDNLTAQLMDLPSSKMHYSCFPRHSFRFSVTGLEKVSEDYSSKIAKGTSTTNTLYQLALNVDEIGRLIDSGRKISVEIQCLLDSLGGVSTSVISTNNQVKKSLTEIIRRFHHYQYTAATHILINPETRPRKPYALSVQCIPYKSLTDSGVREVLNNVNREMTGLGMEVAGK